MNLIPETQDVISSVHRCACAHLNTTLVENLAGMALPINVEIFELIGHPRAKYGYAWRDPRDGHIATVLQIPPVISPRTAVRAVLEDEALAASPAVRDSALVVAQA